MVKGVKCERRKRSRVVPDTGFATYRQVFTCSWSSSERVRSTCTGVGTSQAGNRVRPGESCDLSQHDYPRGPPRKRRLEKAQP